MTAEMVSKTSQIDRTAEHITDALKRPPFFLVLKGLPATTDRSATVNLARAISAIGTGQASKVSFTRVEINLEKSSKHGFSTSTSRTHLPMDVHTDSSYDPKPHELVAFQMVRTSDQGGQSTLVSLEDVLPHLDRTTFEVLQQAIFPFGDKTLPILWPHDTAWRIRYYRTQMEASAGLMGQLSLDAMAATHILDGILKRDDLTYATALQAGDILFLNNTRVLHGRTGFDPNSSRLMYRIRCHAPSLLSA